MSSTSKSTLLKILALVVVLGAIVIWFFSAFEKKESEETIFSSEYKKNPYFLLELFLKKQNIIVTQSQQDFDIQELDDSVGSLLIFDSPNFYTYKNNPLLKEWIYNGGRLISNIDHELKNMEDEFYAEFVVSNHFDAELDDGVGTCYALYSAWISCDDRDVVSSGIDFEALASNSYGAAFIKFKHGSGEIILFSHTDAFQNYGLIKNDNAYFLSRLIKTNKNKVILINHSRPPSLIGSLWATAKLQIIIFIVLLSLLLWSLIQRFGPLKMPELENRQDLRTHINACADYLWQEDQLWTATRQLQDNIKTKAQRILGKQLNLSDANAQAQLVDFIQTRSSEKKSTFNQNTIFEALFGNLPNDEKELTLKTKLLQALWRVI